jgi:hypothetical protein
MGVLTTLIPIVIVILSGHSFSSVYSEIFIRASITLFIVGKGLTAIKKRKEKKSIFEDIGIVMLLLFLLLKGY